MTRLADPRLAALFRVLLGGLFLYAGLLKAADVRGMAEDIANYHLVPAALVPLAAVTVPWIEILLGLGLVLGFWIRGAALLTAALTAVFTVAIAQALLRGIDLTCGCFGGEAPADWGTVLRDVVLLGAALHVAAFDRGVLAPARLLAPGPAR